MTARATLCLTVGLPCTGKTTIARRIEAEHDALRLTKDEWVKALYGQGNPRSAQDVIEGRLIEIGLRVLELGHDVVIDYGLWGRDERSALRQAAADVDATVELRYFELSPDEQRRRLDRRQAEAPHTTWPMADEELAGWAARFAVPTPGELDGTEPIDQPPAGFATWSAWRASLAAGRLPDPGRPGHRLSTASPVRSSRSTRSARGGGVGRRGSRTPDSPSPRSSHNLTVDVAWMRVPGSGYCRTTIVGRRSSRPS